MVVLLEFPEEILNRIVSHFAADIDPLDNKNLRPASNWYEDTSSLTDSIFSHRKVQIRGLHALLLTCRVFRRLVVPFLYFHVNVLNNTSLHHLTMTLTKDKSYKPYIKVATIIGIQKAYDLFFLPKIMEVNMYNPNLWERRRRHKIAQSPVTVMRLINSTLDYWSLEFILSLPKALEELWYEVGRHNWRRFHTTNGLFNEIYDLFPGVLKHQTKHLRKFTFTMGCDYTSCSPGMRIDLRQFQALKHLRIDEIFLTFSARDKVSMSLPTCLEVLEVVNEMKSCQDFELWIFDSRFSEELDWILPGNREGLHLKKVLYENCGPGLRGCDFDYVGNTSEIETREKMFRYKEIFQENGMELTIRLNCYDSHCSITRGHIEEEEEEEYFNNGEEW